MDNIHLFDFEEYNIKKKYESARNTIGNFIGFDNLIRIETYKPNCTLLLELYNQKKLLIACRALDLTNIFSETCDKDFFFYIRLFFKNLLEPEYIIIRNEVYQYLGFDITIRLETDKEFQRFCIKLHNRQDIFLENMRFFKRFVGSDLFKSSKNPYSLYFLEILLYDLGFALLTDHIFRQKFSINELNAISLFLFKNDLKDDESLKIAKFVYSMIDNCTESDISKVYKYKSTWDNLHFYADKFKDFSEIQKSLFISSTKFILFFRTLSKYNKCGNEIFYFLLISNNIDTNRLNKYPYCYARELS